MKHRKSDLFSSAGSGWGWFGWYDSTCRKTQYLPVCSADSHRWDVIQHILTWTPNDLFLRHLDSKFFEGVAMNYISNFFPFSWPLILDVHFKIVGSSVQHAERIWPICAKGCRMHLLLQYVSLNKSYLLLFCQNIDSVLISNSWFTISVHNLHS